MKRLMIIKKIATVLIVSLLVNNVSFAAGFYFDNGVKKWIDEDGTLAIGWRWLDPNNDSICECYRFDEKGALVTDKKIKGKEVNSEGQWVVNGIVQKIYKSSGKPLYEENAGLGKVDTNKYINLGTNSDSRRISASNKDLAKHILGEAELGENNAAYRKSYIGPDMVFKQNEKGYVMSKRAKPINNKAPVATKSNVKVIYYSTEEAIATGSALGKDMRRFVAASSKYTEKVDNVKIYGGDIWNDCMCLQGNGAYVKFNTTNAESKKFKANFFTMEIAHQTHGESTADTYCGVEVYLNGKSVAVYDEFCDDKPELVEEWLDDGESSVQLKLIITGEAKGRKVYIRNARFRQYKEIN